jgi:predicted ATPase
VKGVEGEARWPVPPLTTPDPYRSPTVEELQDLEAARLFVARARNNDSSFAFTPENAHAVAEICRRLEGIPLVIELAATRVGTLSLKHISERLEGSLELLSGGARTAASRQQTLRGTLDWSYELLLEPERKVFRRLSVFAGGWTLEASEAVVSGEGIEHSEVLDLLSGLVEKSLVMAEPTPEGGVRYKKLEPVRQYALEKLEHCGESEAAKRTHAEYFLALAEEAEPELFGPQEAEWFDRLEVEHDNFRAVLSWTIEQGETETALRLAAALWILWFARGYIGEGQRWLEQALTRDGPASTAARAKALEALAWLAGTREDMDRAEAAAEEGLRLSEEAGIRGSLSGRSAFLYTARSAVTFTKNP